MTIINKHGIGWPSEWPRYRQCDVFCDILEGPCSCGAWHGKGEFQLRKGILYRYGESVNSESDIMTIFYGAQVRIHNFSQGLTDIRFPLTAVAFGTAIIGLHFTGNGIVKNFISLMEESVKFPITVNMPCGWSVIVPALQSCRNIACPCGSKLHWIVKWDRPGE